MSSLGIDIGVVIPTRNRYEKTVRAIESVLEQTRPVKQVIVVDDGSDIECQIALRKYCEDTKVEYIYREGFGHPGAARNVGVTALGTEYVAFLDSDDKWLPNKIEIQSKALESSRFRALSSNAYRVKKESTTHFYPQLKKQYCFGDLVFKNWIITSTVIVHRELLLSVGGFPETNTARQAEDYTTWLKIASVNTWGSVDVPLAFYEDEIEVSDRLNHSQSDLIGIIEYLDWEQKQSNEKKKLLGLFKRVFKLGVVLCTRI